MEHTGLNATLYFTRKTSSDIYDTCKCEENEHVLFNCETFSTEWETLKGRVINLEREWIMKGSVGGKRQSRIRNVKETGLIWAII